MANWKIEQAALVTWFYFCTPCVPGGVRRLMLTDDFGNLVTFSIESASISLG